jgi:hypothetical protein
MKIESEDIIEEPWTSLKKIKPFPGFLFTVHRLGCQCFAGTASSIEVDRVDGVSLLPRKVSIWSVQSSGISRRIVWDVNVLGAFPVII